MFVKVVTLQVLLSLDAFQKSKTQLLHMINKNFQKFGLLYLQFQLLMAMMIFLHQSLIDLLTLKTTFGFSNVLMDSSGTTLTVMRLNGLALLAQSVIVLNALQTLSVMNVKKESCFKLMNQNVLTTLTVLCQLIFNLKDLRIEMENGFALNVTLDNTTLKMIEVMRLDVSLVQKMLTQTAELVESLRVTLFASDVLQDLL